jgi:excisionase family DNA binding protein
MFPLPPSARMLRTQNTSAPVPRGAGLNEEYNAMLPAPTTSHTHHAELVIPDGNGRERLEPLQVTINEAARLLAYDSRTIRRLITRGEIAVVGEGRLRRVPVQSLRDYQQRHLIK